MKNDSKFLIAMLPVAIIVTIVLLYTGHQAYAAGTIIAYALAAIVILYGKVITWKPSKVFLQVIIYLSGALLFLSAIFTIGVYVASIQSIDSYASWIQLGMGCIIVSCAFLFGCDKLKDDLYPPGMTITPKAATNTVPTTKNRLDRFIDDDED